MLTTLRRMHRFFTNQLFYPVLLSTFLALGFYAGRVILSSNWVVYRNLVWNLFLAWLPYGFSMLAAGLHHLHPKRWSLLLVPAGLWLAFFPNAPYLLTDFLHLEERPFVPLWYDIGLLVTFAWSGLFLAIASLRTMQALIRTYLGLILSWMFVLGALGLGGLGLYLGRFSRWNSWDLLLQPKDILTDVLSKFLHPLSNLSFFGFTTMFTAFLLVCYLTFINVHRVGEKPPEMEGTAMPPRNGGS